MSGLAARFCCLLLLPSLLAINASRSHAQILNGFTEPYETIQVASAEPGRVAAVYFELGDSVKSGDLILSLDNRVLEMSRRLALAKSRISGEIDFAQTELTAKTNRLDKLKSAQSSGFAGVNEIEIAEQEIASARARLQAARDKQMLSRIEVERIDAELEHRKVRSTINGVITELRHKAGEYVSASQPVTAEIADLSLLRVKFYLLTEQAEQLSEGQPVSLRLIKSGQPVSATVKYIAPITSAKSATVRVDVVIDNAANRLRSGIPIRIELE